jgi:arsenite-transporting ATPase
MGLKSLVKGGGGTVYYFFSGKGGVGKTSIAAATALWFSGGGKKTLIISTDPAHSLSDSFEVKIGGEIKKLKKNLFAVEIDPKKAMQEYKEKFMTGMEKSDFLKGLGLDGMFDVAGMTPGIDEIAAFDKFLQYMQNRDYDIIIFDTAPTGHTLRFLSLPDVLDSWIGKLIKMRMRFSGIVSVVKNFLPFGEPGAEQGFGTEHLDGMKKRISEAKKILSDPEKTNYNIVLISEEMAILESERCIRALKEYHIPVKTVIVNQLIPENPKCGFCTEKRKLQQKRLKTIAEKFRGFRIMKLPLYMEEIKGFGMLRRVGRQLYGD